MTTHARVLIVFASTFLAIVHLPAAIFAQSDVLDPATRILAEVDNLLKVIHHAQLFSVIVGTVVFALTALGLRRLSAKWVLPAPFQWLALLLVPFLAAASMYASYVPDVKRLLDELPEQSLERVPRSQAYMGKKEVEDNVENTLALKQIAKQNDFKLMLEVSHRPASVVCVIALAGSIILWWMTNRRLIDRRS